MTTGSSKGLLREAREVHSELTSNQEEDLVVPQAIRWETTWGEHSYEDPPARPQGGVPLEGEIPLVDDLLAQLFRMEDDRLRLVATVLARMWQEHVELEYRVKSRLPPTDRRMR